MKKANLNLLNNQVLLEGTIVSEKITSRGIGVTLATNRVTSNKTKISDYILVWFEGKMIDVYNFMNVVLYDRVQIVGETHSRRIYSSTYGTTSYTQFITAKNIKVSDKFNKGYKQDTNDFILKGVCEKIISNEKGSIVTVNLCEGEFKNFPQVFTYVWKPDIKVGDVIVIRGGIQSSKKKYGDSNKKSYSQMFIANKIQKVG